ncbi:MAG TPA: guanylate kinase [Longimicrobiales bacterium]
MVGRSFPLVIAAPSGAGKTSLARALVERRSDVVFSISATTRPRREYETSGKDYYFVDDAEFDRMIAAGELLEWATVHGRRYGTPRAGVAHGLEQGRVVVLDIDIQGARQVRDLFPDAVLVFILPPSAGELERRLAKRGSEARAEVDRRLAGARRELPLATTFDYVVVNDDFERAVNALDCIVTAERHRRSRMSDLERELARLDAELGRILDRRG